MSSSCGGGGTLEIGEDLKHRSFATVRLKNVSRTVQKMVYRDFKHLLGEMDSQAKEFLAERHSE
ncbi:MAG: hypothetical protein WD049_07305 [Candidatus Paceibacterota bacterium]